MLALNPVVVDAVWRSFAAYLPTPTTRSAVIGRGSRTETASRPSCSGCHRVLLGRGRKAGQRW